MASDLGNEPGPHWCERSALTTTPPLLYIFILTDLEIQFALSTFSTTYLYLNSFGSKQYAIREKEIEKEFSSFYAKIWGVWKSGNPESGIGTGIGTGTGNGTGIGTGMGRETYKKQGQHLP